MLHNPYEPAKTTWENYRHEAPDPQSLCDNIIYSIGEDPATRTLWVGTQRGLSLLHDGTRSITNIYQGPEGSKVREVTSIVRDRMGLMWAGILGGGAITFNNRHNWLGLDNLDPIRNRFGVNAVRYILADSRGRLWVSLDGNSGLVVYNPSDGSLAQIPDLPVLATHPKPYTAQSLMESRDHRIFVGGYDIGVYIISPDGRSVEHHMSKDTPWLEGDRVSEIFEDSSGRIWFGSLPGLSVMMPDGTSCRFSDVLPGKVKVSSIAEGRDGCIWVATDNLGMLRIDGTGTDPQTYTIKHYTPERGTLNSMIMTSVYVDADGRVWAGADGAGLSIYNYAVDRFVPVHMRWNLPGDMISSIRSDSSGSLWLGTNMGLMRLTVAADTTLVKYRLYTAGDGTQANLFHRGAACVGPDGRLYFGGPNGLNVISGNVKDDDDPPIPVNITDIRVGGTSFDLLPAKEREGITPLSPPYASELHLSHDRNNFSVEFAVIDFVNHPAQHKYAYRLDGFDNDWHYTDYSRRWASYNNLPPGDYTFRVKATDSQGRWNSAERVLKVHIAPPLWATWWAKVIYVLVLAGIFWWLTRIVRRRQQRKTALHMRELELAQAEELNRTKLRFFTNITHEWLTPLSIISAVSEEMKAESPKFADYHKIMSANVGRLTRLLQQVIEFRKTENGQLRLRVRRGDMVSTVSEIVANISPMMKSRNISCTFRTSVPHLEAWFDADKIDKVLYNLLSNAAKYANDGSHVEVNLDTDPMTGTVRISVRDDGPGIPESELPKVFNRFYVGENHKENTSGNGIGLSLTKDLVELHRGTISVKSTPGSGTEFIVTLPCRREAYLEGELEPSAAASLAGKPSSTAETADGGDAADRKLQILIVEDDKDLLHLLSQLLGTEYRVFAAETAEEATPILKSHDISLVITDLMLPGEDGAELCRRIKTDIETSHIPVLILTANNLEETKVDAYEAGADAFMPKPFSLTVLQARITNLLRSRLTSKRLFREQFATNIEQLNFSTLDEDFIKRATDCIMRHLSDPDYSLPAFEAEIGMSKSTINRKLKSLTGLSFQLFVRNIRLKAACRLMQEKHSARVSELAYAVGFNDPKYFSLCFKNEFGMLPTDYLDQFADAPPREP